MALDRGQERAEPEEMGEWDPEIGERMFALRQGWLMRKGHS